MKMPWIKAGSLLGKGGPVEAACGKEHEWPRASTNLTHYRHFLRLYGLCHYDHPVIRVKVQGAAFGSVLIWPPAARLADSHMAN